MRLLLLLILPIVACGGDKSTGSKEPTRLEFTLSSSGSNVVLSNPEIHTDNVAEVLVAEDGAETPFAIAARNEVSSHEATNRAILAFSPNGFTRDPVLPIYSITEGALVISDPRSYFTGATIIVVLK